MAPPPRQALKVEEEGAIPPTQPPPGGKEGGWLLIDGSSLIFRAFYGVPATIRSPDGRPVNAIRGFVDVLARLLQERLPARALIATDEDWRPAFRVDLIPSYKAHRVAEPVPPALEPQIPIAWEVLAAIGIEVLGAPGYEAEDVIASMLVRIGPRASVEIVSGDRDLFALVHEPWVRVLYPEGKGRFTLVDESEVSRRYGIPGRSYLDYAVLRGDPSDGLPGLKGVGDRKAAGLVTRHGSLAAMVGAGIFSAAELDYLERAQQVVRPVTNLEIAMSGHELPRSPVDENKLEELQARHGLDGPIQRLLDSLAARP